MTHIIIALILLPLVYSQERHNHGRKCVHIDYRGKDISKESKECPDNDICSKTFNISYVHMPPYSAYPIDVIIRKCCGNCTKVTHVNAFANITEVTPSSINTSDFVLLFLGNTNAKTLYGYHFIPVVNAPSVFYITKKDEPVMNQLMTSCLNLYPLIVICLLMAAVSGFVAWILETWLNWEEFPRPFLIGWFEGFWWSFVSMTTVGYGDKTPKSFGARIFSIIWILIGVALFGIFTALLTAEVMDANFPPNPQMSGANVGALKFREYDASVIAGHGGSVVETDGWDFLSDVFLLIEKLQEGEIDGFVLDKYTLRSTISNLKLLSTKNETSYRHKHNIQFFLTKTLRTKKLYDGEKLSYGILVKNDVDHDFFRPTIIDNRLPLETAIALDWNKMEPRGEERVLFSPQNPYFIASLKVIAYIFASIFVFGLCFEICRKYCARFEKDCDTRYEQVPWSITRV